MRSSGCLEEDILTVNAAPVWAHSRVVSRNVAQSEGLSTIFKSLLGMCAQLPKGCRWEMEMRAQSEPTWRSIHSSSSTSSVTADDLIPGTKYVFRARAGTFHTSSRNHNW